MFLYRHITIFAWSYFHILSVISINHCCTRCARRLWAWAAAPWSAVSGSTQSTTWVVAAALLWGRGRKNDDGDEISTTLNNASYMKEAGVNTLKSPTTFGGYGTTCVYSFHFLSESLLPVGTKWVRHISQERFYFELPNFAHTLRLTSCTAMPNTTPLATSIRLQNITEYRINQVDWTPDSTESNNLTFVWRKITTINDMQNVNIYFLVMRFAWPHQLVGIWFPPLTVLFKQMNVANEINALKEYPKEMNWPRILNWPQTGVSGDLSLTQTSRNKLESQPKTETTVRISKATKQKYPTIRRLLPSQKKKPTNCKTRHGTQMQQTICLNSPIWGNLWRVMTYSNDCINTKKNPFGQWFIV